MTAKELLEKARDHIKDPARWHQGCKAVSREELSVSPTSPYARKWCATGAVDYFEDNWDSSDWQKARTALDAAARHLGFRSATSLNDNNTHDEVMKMFSLALEKVS